MTLRQRTPIFIALSLIVQGIALYIISYTLLMKGFAKLEEETAPAEVQRVKEALHAEIEALNVTARQLAAWDESYQFIEDANERFVKSNVTEATLRSARLDLIMAVHSSGRVVLAQGFDLDSGRKRPVPREMDSHLASGLLWRHPTPDSHVEGILLLSEGPMLICSRPIVTSEGKGPIHGALIAGRFLDAREITRLSTATHLAISTQRLDDPKLPENLKRAGAAPKESAALLRPLSEHCLAGYFPMRDIYGKPALLVQVKIPRRFYQQGLITLRNFILAMLGIGLGAGVVILIAIERDAFSRLSRLNAEVKGIGAAVSPSARVSVSGRDEIGDLAAAVNGMLEAVQRSEADLRQSEERYRNLASSLPDVVYEVSGEGGTLTSLNPAFEKITGWSCAEWIGKPFLPLVHPDDQARALETFQKAIQGEAPPPYELRVRGKSGEYFYGEFTSMPAVKGGRVVGAMGIARDITERKRIERTLAESEEKYRTLFMDSLEAMSLTVGGRIVDVSPAWLRLHGYGRKDEVIGMDILKVVHPDDHKKLLERRKMSVYERERICQVRDLRKDGGVVDVELYSSAVVLGGRLHILTTVRDISARRRAEEEVQRLTRDLERGVAERTAQLEAANKELEAFSYSVSHDLRNPLHTMHGFSQLLLQEYTHKLDEQGKHYLGRISAACVRMGELIDDLLSLSRVTRQEMRRGKVDLSAMARSIAEDLRRGRPDRQVEFIVPPKLEVEGDPHLLRIAMENMIGNAWKYTGKRPNARIELGTLERAGKRTFFVRDNGVGFDMAHTDRLFGAFQRLHSAKEFEGTGIGLATVQRIIRRHGGQVWAEGQVDKGATFYFTL